MNMCSVDVLISNHGVAASTKRNNPQSTKHGEIEAKVYELITQCELKSLVRGREATAMYIGTERSAGHSAPTATHPPSVDLDPSRVAESL